MAVVGISIFYARYDLQSAQKQEWKRENNTENNCINTFE
jgi:hypothetical protein